MSKIGILRFDIQTTPSIRLTTATGLCKPAPACVSFSTPDTILFDIPPSKTNNNKLMGHAKPGKIPDEVKQKAQAIIARFNQEHSRREDCFYLHALEGNTCICIDPIMVALGQFVASPTQVI